MKLTTHLRQAPRLRTVSVCLTENFMERRVSKHCCISFHFACVYFHCLNRFQFWGREYSRGNGTRVTACTLFSSPVCVIQFRTLGSCRLAGLLLTQQTFPTAQIRASWNLCRTELPGLTQGTDSFELLQMVPNYQHFSTELSESVSVSHLGNNAAWTCT